MRRVAREMALKVLFQVDVGKQPLEEVLAGASAQILTLAENSSNQVAHDAEVSLRAIAGRRTSLSGSNGGSRQSRRIKAAATSMGKEVRALAARATEIASELCARPTEGSALSAIQQMEAAATESVRAIRQIGARDSGDSETLQALLDSATLKIDTMAAAFAKHAPVVEGTSSFMRALVAGVTEKRNEIDARLAELSEGWTLDRQAAVDRNIMRLSAYELLYMPSVPAGPSINEAVELAKKYSTAESGRFVNGVLGALYESLRESGSSGNRPPLEPLDPLSKGEMELDGAENSLDAMTAELESIIENDANSEHALEMEPV